MGRVRPRAFVPDESRSGAYDRMFAEYLELHDHFGRDVAAMRRLRGIRRDAVARRHGDASGPETPAPVGNQEVSV
jgi:L-ribulokinase